ncbi:hypothetical protein BZZ01_07290 [Nostocales cyanobacterium HT-58-2]|nr:hypothetical protein BZZ01_07290 [Nostocales cyanobacterium HT-58-2]
MPKSNKEPLPYQTICLECIFHTLVEGAIECIHPDELEANCSTVIFCNSFQSVQEVESPCVSFDYEDPRP